MPLTLESYYKKAHVYLESPGGRKELFDLFRREVEKGLQDKEKIINAVVRLRILKSYLKGDSFVFIDSDIPNVFQLRQKMGEIRQDALLFLRDNIDLVKKVYLSTNDATHKFDILYLLGKFMPEIPDLRMRHYTDLYFLLFHTVMFADNFIGKGNDLFDLGDLAIRSFARYDCAETGEYFLADAKLRELLKEYASKYPPYENYAKRFHKIIQEIETRRRIDEEALAPLYFTDRLLYLVSGIKKETFFRDNKDKVFSHIRSVCLELFDEKNDEREMLINKTETVLNLKIKKIEDFSAKKSPSEPLYQGQQTKTL